MRRKTPPIFFYWYVDNFFWYLCFEIFIKLFFFILRLWLSSRINLPRVYQRSERAAARAVVLVTPEPMSAAGRGAHRRALRAAMEVAGHVLTPDPMSSGRGAPRRALRAAMEVSGRVLCRWWPEASTWARAVVPSPLDPMSSGRGAHRRAARQVSGHVLRRWWTEASTLARAVAALVTPEQQPSRWCRSAWTACFATGAAARHRHRLTCQWKIRGRAREAVPMPGERPNKKIKKNCLIYI